MNEGVVGQGSRWTGGGSGEHALLGGRGGDSSRQRDDSGLSPRTSGLLLTCSPV